MYIPLILQLVHDVAVVIPMLEVPVIHLIPLISLLLVVPNFSVALLVHLILLYVSKVHSMCVRGLWGVIASLKFGTGYGEMWYGITSVHTLLAKKSNGCT